MHRLFVSMTIAWASLRIYGDVICADAHYSSHRSFLFPESGDVERADVAKAIFNFSARVILYIAP